MGRITHAQRSEFAPIGWLSSVEQRRTKRHRQVRAQAPAYPVREANARLAVDADCPLIALQLSGSANAKTDSRGQPCMNNGPNSDAS